MIFNDISYSGHNFTLNFIEDEYICGNLIIDVVLFAKPMFNMV